MKIYVGGVNASGKSTLLEEVSKISNYDHIRGSAGLLNHLGFNGDYEKLRALSDEESKAAYRQYLQELLEMENNFLLDAHYLSLVRGDVRTGTNDLIEKFDAFILISAPLETVWHRISTDSSKRDRAMFPSEMNTVEMKKMLAEYQQQTKDEFLRLAKLYKKPYLEVVNEQDHLDNAAVTLLEFILD
jgi:adenylate kinase